MTWETWIESLSPGDPVWHTDGSKGVFVLMGITGAYVSVDDCDRFWPFQDLMQPATTPFHIWAAAQGEGE